jgi:hypothetical protein
MVKFKNISVPKRGGGTRLQRVQVLANGKYKFVKNTGRKTRNRPKSQKKRSARKRRVVRKRISFQKHKGGNSMGKPFHLAANLGLAAVPSFIGLSAAFGEMDWREALGHLVAAYTFWNPMTGSWDPMYGVSNYVCIGAGMAASKLAAKFGLNKLTWKGFNI